MDKFIEAKISEYNKNFIERSRVFNTILNFKMSLSAMTYSHQMVRLIFLEQLYRAFSIIRNEPYHHA